MAKKLKKIPHFENEDEEAEFWATHNSTEYFDWSKAKVFNNPNKEKQLQEVLKFLNIKK